MYCSKASNSARLPAGCLDSLCPAQMNITSKAQYLSTTSAGAWVAVPYAYTSAPLNRFFSPYYEPNNLTTARLSTTLNPGSWGQYAAGKTLLSGALGNPGGLTAYQ